MITSTQVEQALQHGTEVGEYWVTLSYHDRIPKKWDDFNRVWVGPIPPHWEITLSRKESNRAWRSVKVLASCEAAKAIERAVHAIPLEDIVVRDGIFGRVGWLKNRALIWEW